MWYFILFLLCGVFFLTVTFIWTAGYLFNRFAHRCLQKSKSEHQKVSNVSITPDYSFNTENTHHFYFGKIDRFSVSIQNNTSDWPEYAYTLYAAFDKAKSKKWTDTPGDLTYYLYNGQPFYVSFKPYSKEDGYRYAPEIKLTTIGTVCLSFLWILVPAVTACIVYLWLH